MNHFSFDLILTDFFFLLENKQNHHQQKQTKKHHGKPTNFQILSVLGIKLQQVHIFGEYLTRLQTPLSEKLTVYAMHWSCLHWLPSF